MNKITDSESDGRGAKAELGDLLAKSGLSNQPGKLLYSGTNTLCRGDLYLLNFNPGGSPSDETETIGKHLEKVGSDWNEFVDGIWSPRGRPLAPGEADLQKRTRWLVEQLGYDIRKVCASNLIFLRSPNEATLRGTKELIEKCWPIHEWILRRVRPAALICSVRVFKNMSRRYETSPVESFPSGHDGLPWCYSSQITVDNSPIDLIGIPHLSRYNIDAHPEVVQWAKRLIRRRK